MYEIFEKLREAKGVTAYEVAKACGFHQVALSRWKAGVSVPNTDKLMKIADYFGVPLQYLMTGDVQTLVQPEAYTESTEVTKILHIIEQHPEAIALIKAIDGSSPEDVEIAANVLNAMKRKKK